MPCVRAQGSAVADEDDSSSTWTPAGWMDKPGVNFDKDACDLFGKRIEMRPTPGADFEPAVIKVYTPCAKDPYGVVFDSKPDKTRFENLLRRGRTDWKEVDWDGDIWDTRDLRPMCPRCAHPLDEGRVAWTRCTRCGEMEPGASSDAVSTRKDRQDVYRYQKPNYAESDDE